MGHFKNMCTDAGWAVESKVILLGGFFRWLLDEHPEDDEIFELVKDQLPEWDDVSADDVISQLMKGDLEGRGGFCYSDLITLLPPGHWDRLKELIVEFLAEGTAPKVASIRHRAIIFKINKLYRSNMSSQELYETTRGVWRVSIERAMDAELAMAVYQGVVIEVYRINNWYPAGTLKYQYRDDTYEPIYKDRWEFDGEIAEDLRDEYVGKTVETGRYPVGYVNC